MDEEQRDEMGCLAKKIEELNRNMNKMNVAEYIELMRSPLYMLYINFLAGLARGLGIAIGATLLGGVFLFFLFRLADLNLPLIGEFIARLVSIVSEHL